MFPAWKNIINTIQTILNGILLDVTGLLTNFIVILRPFFSDISFYLLTIPLPQLHFLIYNHFLICSLPKSFQFSSAPHILVYLITQNHPLLTIPPSPLSHPQSFPTLLSLLTMYVEHTLSNIPCYPPSTLFPVQRPFLGNAFPWSLYLPHISTSYSFAYPSPTSSNSQTSRYKSTTLHNLLTPTQGCMFFIGIYH